MFVLRMESVPTKAAFVCRPKLASTCLQVAKITGMVSCISIFVAFGRAGFCIRLVSFLVRLSVSCICWFGYTESASHKFVFMEDIPGIS